MKGQGLCFWECRKYTRHWLLMLIGWTCAIYDCTVYNKTFKSCGECEKAPCDIWMKTRDPKYSDEEFAQNVKMRIQALRQER